MKKVKELLQEKGHIVWTIAPQATVFDALKLMSEKEIGALVVVEGGTVVGIISERDYARKVSLHGKSSKDTLVSDIMTTRVAYVGPEQNVGECMALMTEKRYRHLPVLSDGQLIGIVSIGDVVKEVISEQEFMISQLERYITGN